MTAEVWISGEQSTVLDLLRRRLDADPDGEYLDVCGTKLSAAEVASAANRLANALAKRAAEPVRHAKRALVPRHTQRCRQRHEREIGLGEVGVHVRIVLRRSLRSRRRKAAYEQRQEPCCAAKS